MRAVLSITLVFLTVIPMFHQAYAQVTVGPNVDIAGENAPDRQRVEPTIAVDPHDPNVIVAGAQDLSLVGRGEHRWHGYYRSTDNGQTWSSSLLPGFPGDTSQIGRASPLHGSNTTSDPVLAFDANGNLYYTGLVFNLSASGVPGPARVFVAKYVNDGATYSGASLVPSTRDTDKPWIAVDTTAGSGRGNVYLTFDGSINGRFTLLFTRSTDGGRIFSDPMRVSEHGGVFSGITVSPGGNIFVSFLGPGDSFQHILVSMSDDRGSSFHAAVMIAKISPLPKTTLPGNSFRVFTLPQIASDSRGVYVVWDSFAGDQANILLTRSTDDGQTWKSPVRVNQPTEGEHFFPTIAVSSGIVGVAWYDGRLGQLSDGTIIGLNLFFAESKDGGATFPTDMRVTTTSFDPNIVKRTDAPGTISVFMGDYISMAAGPANFHPVWTDNSNACETTDPKFGCVDQNAFTASVVP